MAFGRSNSLSINTGASNSLFGQQPQASQQPSTLFGAPTNNATATNQTSSLFGASAAQPSTQQQPSLFSNLNTAAQPAVQQNSLFGGSNTLAPPATQQSNLFGNNAATTQPATQPTSLFGNSTTSLFGKSTATNTATAQPSLFGAQTNSIFGKPANVPASTSLFGSSLPAGQAAPAPSNSVFGMSGVPINQLNQASLLNASQFRQTQATPFAGRLTMGQNATASASTGTVGAVRVSLDDMRSTTRFQDLIDPLKEEFERADKMIQAQENFCRQIEALRIVHDRNVQSLTPDVSLVTEKADLVEQVLTTDAQAVQEIAQTTSVDRKNFERCRRIAENLAFPVNYHLPHSSALTFGNLSAGQQRAPQPAGGTDQHTDTYDTDMIGAYFVPLAAELQKTIETFTSNLAEIESHMGVIEGAAINQAKQLAARRLGAAPQLDEQDTVRSLADTLRGFEQGILGVAGVIGQCREGVTELSLGRISKNARSNERVSQPW